MGRLTIWQDGVKTQFTKENQPPNRGRKKGRPNRATVYRRVLAILTEHQTKVEQLRRDNRNARRRERYRTGAPAEKKWAGGTTPQPDEPKEPPLDSDQTK